MTGGARDALRLVLAERYAVERQLGRGGMVGVYLARDLRLYRPVARRSCATSRVGEGARRVVAYQVANTHADGNVAHYVRSARVLFQGDRFYIPERRAVPPAFGDTEAITAMVRTRRLRLAQVVGVHGRTGTWAEVRASVRRSPMPEAGPVR